MKKTIALSLLSLAVLFLAGCGNKQITQYQPTVQPKISEQICNKEENCCAINEDCKYIWYTGGCNTSEYVAKKQKEAQEKGMFISEAPRRENVTCTCENNKCVTHN